MAVTGTLKPTPTYEPPEQVIYDMSLDYDGVTKTFYTRSDVDHRIYIPDNHDIMVNPDTGEIRAMDNNNYS